MVAIGDRQPYITALIDRSPGRISRPAAADLSVKTRSPYARIAYLSTMGAAALPAARTGGRPRPGQEA